MRKCGGFLFNTIMLAIFPAIAGAAGTYYNGNLYQKNQYGYGYNNSYAQSNNRGYTTTNRYGQTTTTRRTMQTTTHKSAKAASKNTKKQGFVLDAGLSHEFANWNFDMNTAGSKLDYNSVNWNILSGNAKYYFGDSTPMQINLGLRYGVQSGSNPMVDDDITSGGILGDVYAESDDSTSSILGYRVSHALSVGTSKGGDQFGFNVGFGLTDAFSVGRMKITPSVGYRYFKHHLKTEKNYGVTMDVFWPDAADDIATCIEVQKGEIQCIPYMAFVVPWDERLYLAGFDVDSEGNLVVDGAGNYIISVPSGSGIRLDPGESFYYEQSGVSHDYETIWAGPYVALDMEYEINNDNSVVAGIELGLPIYDSKGNQPYRVDWAHPTSVEDKAGFGDAVHLGLNANWLTSISDSVSLSVGLTYDYYKVSKATAITYFNSSFYTNLLDEYEYLYSIAADADVANALSAVINTLEEDIAEKAADGWKQEDKDEINSIYKSMGIRIGFVAKF